MCVCVRACVRACACVYVCVCSVFLVIVVGPKLNFSVRAVDFVIQMLACFQVSELVCFEYV